MNNGVQPRHHLYWTPCADCPRKRQCTYRDRGRAALPCKILRFSPVGATACFCAISETVGPSRKLFIRPISRFAQLRKVVIWRMTSDVRKCPKWRFWGLILRVFRFSRDWTSLRGFLNLHLIKRFVRTDEADKWLKLIFGTPRGSSPFFEKTCFFWRFLKMYQFSCFVWITRRISTLVKNISSLCSCG